MKLQKETRIYYAGDMANRSGLGKITEIGNIGYGDFANIKMDDGREFVQLSLCNFSEEYLGHSGTKFVTEEAYLKWKEQIAKRHIKINLTSN